MPLSAAAPLLKEDIQSAYQTAKIDGSNGNKGSSIIISELALAIASAIHSYTLQALVTTQDTSNVGQTDVPGSGVTSVEGKGTGSGNLL
tara:strand:+ start:917 stop:1183 length:267 start_codon:yes stop_codon:yes gene_type:complete